MSSSTLRENSKRKLQKYNYLLKKPDRTSKTSEGDKEFESFVCESTLLADKSEFVYAILERACMRKILLTIPSGWGKTILLTMAKLFFAYNFGDEDDKENIGRQSLGIFGTEFEKSSSSNGKFRIMNQNYANFRAQHFHGHPTIYLDCSNIKGNYQTIEEELGKKITDLLREHEHLLEWKNVLKTKQEKRFENGMKAKYKEQMDNLMNWNEAVNALTTILHLSSGRRTVIILIDGYDSPIINQRNFGESSEFDRSIDLVNDWIQAFEAASNVELLLVAGTFWFPLTGMDFHHFGVDESRPPTGQVVEPINPEKGVELLEFFGLSNEEFEEYCQCYDFDDELKSIAQKHYNGLAINGKQLYRTNSVIKMMKDWARRPNKRSFQFMKSYARESTFINQLLPLFRSSKVSDVIKHLLSDKEWRVQESYCAAFQREQMNQVRRHAKSLSNGENVENNSDECVQLVMQILLAAGYVVRVQNKLSIPNNEMRNLLQSHIMDYYYKKKYAFDPKLLQKIADNLEQVIYKDRNDPELLAHALCDMFNAVKKDVATNEHHTHVIFEIALMLLNGRTFLAGDYILGGAARKDLHRPDIIFCSETQKVAVCVELKYGKITWTKKTPKYALHQIAKNKYITGSKIAEMHSVDTILAIGMNAEREILNDSGDVVMKVKIEMRRAKREGNVGIKQFLTNFEESLRSLHKI